MQTYASVLLYAIPLFVIMVLIEIAYGYFVKNQMHNVMDTVSSLSSGITNIIKDTLGLGIGLIGYTYLVEHLAIVEVKSTWLTYVIGFIALDFAGYVNHWLAHKVNYFWNEHVVHHSSEEFNLACALRQSISTFFKYGAILLIPAAILGVPQKVVAVLGPLHLFGQFWYHTRHIGKLGFLEYLIITPSQHRVHHAINPEYIDKNLGQIFPWWDFMFGTYQEELDDVPPQYGVLKPAATWNPILINFQHLWRLIKDAWRTNSFWDKLRIWFMPTGWRPADVAQKYPVAIIEDVYNFKKYMPPASTALQWYSIFQVLANTALMMFMFYNFDNLSRNELLLYGAFVFVGVYGYTSLMDRKYSGMWIEAVKSLGGIALIWSQGSWFGIENYLSWGNALIVFFMLISLVGGVYFTLKDRKGAGYRAALA
ncbi:sterol desaturase family protein [Sediminicola luteus]|uniref:Sterol desaturase n=1 Tax=Sediminicola luteus TaxID=319238 RepID=A0A2A4G4W4_9FLAO|nr:sterol desaturase family protein [Sediminicola luteus]PCE63471.1 sterol desaturase [Sediminicola luteus]